MGSGLGLSLSLSLSLSMSQMEMGKTASERGGARAPGPSPDISGRVDGDNGSSGTYVYVGGVEVMGLATMGAVAPMTTEMTTLVPGCTAQGGSQMTTTASSKSWPGRPPKSTEGMLHNLYVLHFWLWRACPHSMPLRPRRMLNKARPSSMTETSLGRTGPSCRAARLRIVAQRHPLPLTIQVGISGIQDDDADQAMLCPLVHREPRLLQLWHAK